MWEYAAMAGAAAFRAYSAYDEAVTRGSMAITQARGQQVSAENTLADLPLARVVSEMAGTQVDMARRQGEAQTRTLEANLERLRLDRDMIELAAVEAETERRRVAGIESSADIAMSAAMGLDPYASGSFAALAAEKRLLAERDIAAIRINAAAEVAGNTEAQIGNRANAATLLQQRGGVEVQAAEVGRGRFGLDLSERQARFSLSAARQMEAIGRKTQKGAWLNAVGSLISSGSSFAAQGPRR